MNAYYQLCKAGSGTLYSVSQSVVGSFLAPRKIIDLDGTDYIPSQGAAMLVANHKSLWDIPLMSCFIDRHIHFVAKKELFEGSFFLRALGTYLGRVGTIKHNRDQADSKTVRAIYEYINNGELVCIYPEGTRQRTHYIHPFDPGAARIAIKKKVPVIPIGASWDAGWRCPAPSRWPAAGTRKRRRSIQSRT
jgi:1-acyl-sn-glycerol-3-phosphate acyltransferase